MKNTILKICGIAILAFSLPAFADKIVIKGEPVLLEKRGEIYYAPATLKTTNTYQYVTIGTEKRVCYLEKQPDLVSLNVLMLNVDVGGQQHTWNCYSYDPNFFVNQ